MKKQHSSLLISISVITILLLPVVLAYSKAEIISESTGQKTNLYYDTLSNSYGDQGGRNNNIVLRLYSDNPAEFSSAKYAAIVYSDSENKNNIILQNVLRHMGFDDDGINYNVEGNYIDTDLVLSTSQALYPGFIYAAISDDENIDSNDVFVPIDSGDSWLVGIDGGEPCTQLGKQWLIQNNCNTESFADSKYDSFDISFQQINSELQITVDKAYWPSDTGNAVEIDRDGELIIEIKDKSGKYIDSAISEPGSTTLLNAKSYSDIEIYVNSIKTAEAKLSASEPASSASSAASKPSSRPGSSYVSKIEFDFPEIPELDKATIYLKSPLTQPTLTIKEQSSKTREITYSLNTNIDEKNIDSTYLSFHLSRSWLLNNDLDSDQVYLYQNTERFIPEITQQDSEFVYYLIKLRKLTDFTIGNLDMQEEPYYVPPAKEPEQQETAVTPALQLPSNSLFIISYLVLVVFFALVLYTLFRKKK